MAGSAANADATIAWRLAIPAPAAFSEPPAAAVAAPGPSGDASSPTAAGAAAHDTSLQTTSAIARGDAEAFARFYEVWFDRMVHMARSITGRDESFCLDVTQDAMLRIVRSMRPLASEDDLRRWLLRLVHTAAIDRLRAEQRCSRRERCAADGALPRTANNGADPALAEQIALLRAQLDALGPADRNLLLLRFGRATTLRVAATAAGITDGQAHGRIRRATRRLREMMETSDDS